MDSLKWFKSSYSSGNGQCVECAPLPGGVMAVRDSKNPGGEMLVFGEQGWGVFVDGVREA